MQPLPEPELDSDLMAFVLDILNGLMHDFSAATWTRKVCRLNWWHYPAGFGSCYSCLT